MKNNHSWFTPLNTKRIAWLHIFLQFAFPLAFTFSPAATASEREMLTSTAIYTLSAGETVASVADKYHTSVQVLRELNQLRTFAHGFDNLHEGDELEVPRFIAGKKPLALNSPPPPSTTLHTLAGLATRVASAPDHDAMTSTAFGLASNEISQRLQQWLEKIGTAQVQLALNADSGLTNSQFDMLVPLWEREERLIFSQQSLHRTDDRAQANAGLGYRAFHDKWMWGANTFFDYDLSRRHMRLGTGIEYWRDYMKFGANSYLRLSNWIASPTMKDYQERPANGWDMRAQAWLPALPQLGGELVYEQYYGKRVALFNKEHRQHNPRAITLGVNYTPFPLLTLNAARSQGVSGKGDTRVGMQLRYQPGEAWRKQVDPGAVAQMHSLAADRHALVERNNNIVLDYRKKVVIRLQTTARIAGFAGEEKSLGVVVNSQHGLEKITWSAAALIAAGGQIVQKSASDFSVILPEYQNGPESSNLYSIRAVAVDSQGNASPMAETQVAVVQGTFDTTMSSFSPMQGQLLADGKSQLQMVLTVNDSKGNPVDIDARDISVQKKAKLRANVTSELSAFTRRAPGEYVATLTASTRAENFILTPFVHNAPFASANIIITADNASAQIAAGDLVVIKDNARADGSDTNSIKATVTDANGNLLENQTVSFSADNGATIANSAMTDSDGTVMVTLTNTTAGRSHVTATVNSSSQRLSLNFVVDNSTARIASGDLVVIKDNARADGTDTNSIKATVTDAQGNALAGQSVSFSADNGASIVATGTTGSDGSTTVTLTNTTAGQSSVMAKVNGQLQQQTLMFVADNFTAQFSSGALVVERDSAKANGMDTNIIKAIVTDGHGNRVANQAVSFSADNGGTIATTGTTDDSGEVAMTLTSTKAGQSTVTASIDSSIQRQTLTFVADDSTAQIAQGDLVVVTDNAKANGSEANSVKATITDMHRNVLPGQSVMFSTDNGATISGNTLTGSDGSVTVLLTHTKGGPATVTATINGSIQSEVINFVANSGTARLGSGALAVASDNALADGKATNSVKATVTDAYGNILPGQTVKFSADNGAKIAASGTTASDGSVTVSLTNTKAGPSTVTATINGTMQTQQLTFVANGSTARIDSSNLVVESDNAKADGTATNSVKATVTDAQGNALAGQTVKFTADNGAKIAASGTTASDGSVTVSLTSIKAGKTQVTAGINNSTQHQTLTFVADSSTARIVSSDLVVESDNAKADGTATNSVKATVTDAQGNALAGQTVKFTADNGAKIAASGTTASDGSVTVSLTSIKAGKTQVTAGINNSTQHQTLTFVADSSTAQISNGSLQVLSNNAKADGTATNSVKATVTDAQGNALAGQTVKFTADNGAKIAASGTTASDGSVTVSLTSIKAGKTQVTAGINNSTQHQTLTFVADSSTAQISNGSLQVLSNNAKADGTATNSVKATVTDAQGNALAGQTVKFSADNGAKIAASGTTASDGSVTVSLTSIKAGKTQVTAGINNSAQHQTLTFVADSSTAQISNGSLQVLSDNAKADGTATNSVKATVTDAQGNALAGQTVKFTADNGAKIAASGATASDGSVTVSLTSIKAGKTQVTAGINNSAQHQTLTFVADSSTARIVSSDLVVESNNAIADGNATNSVKATVTDAHGNILAGQTVNFTADNSATIAASGTTDNAGSVTMTLTSATAGQSNVTAALNGSRQTVAVMFAADTRKALLASLTIVTNNMGADGRSANKVKATVTDATGTPLPGRSVNFSANNGVSIAASATTSSDGSVTVSLTSTIPGQSQVTATIDGTSKTQNVTFASTIYTLAIAERTFYNASYHFNMLVTNVVAGKVTASSQGRFTQDLTLGEDLIATCPAGTKKSGQQLVVISGSKNIRSVYQGVVQFSPFQSKPADGGDHLAYSNVDMNASLDRISANTWIIGKSHTLTRNTILGNIKLLLTLSSSTYEIGSVGVTGKGAVNIGMGNKRLPALTTSARSVNFAAGMGPCN